MSARVLLVHPDRYLQLAAALSASALLACCGIDPVGCGIDIEIKQSSYVPLTTQTRQPRPWWAFWRPKYVTTEKPLLGFFYTERGAGEPIPLPHSFTTKNHWLEEVL